MGTSKAKVFLTFLRPHPTGAILSSSLPPFADAGEEMMIALMLKHSPLGSRVGLVVVPASSLLVGVSCPLLALTE